MAIGLGWALIIWAVVTIIIFAIARAYRIRVWSSIILSLVISTTVLMSIHRPDAMRIGLNQQSGLEGLYSLIMFIVPLIMLIYVIGKSVTDQEDMEVAVSRRKVTRVTV